MSVVVIFSGRLGNNLFQYAFGRLIAEHHGFELRCRATQRGVFTTGDPVVDKGQQSTLIELKDYFPGAPLYISGKRFDHPVQTFESGEHWRGNSVDLGSVLSDASPRQIVLDGWFQRIEYYAPHLNRLRRWFRPNKIVTWAPGPNDVLLNFRRGNDFGGLGWTLPLDYYERALASMTKVGRVYVCGIGVDALVKERLARFDPVYHQGTPIEDFCFILGFRRIVLSNSTFAWWAAFLSEASEIVAAPSSSEYMGTNFHMQDVRYRELPVDFMAAMARFHRDPRARVAVCANSGNLTIESANGLVRSIRTDECGRRLARWLGDHQGPVFERDLQQQHGGKGLTKLVDALTEAGLLADKTDLR
jgi:hypothetical protein